MSRSELQMKLAVLQDDLNRKLYRKKRLDADVDRIAGEIEDIRLELAVHEIQRSAVTEIKPVRMEMV